MPDPWYYVSMRRRYVVLTVHLAVADPATQPVRLSRRFWTRRSAERWARLYEREAWRSGILADAWVVNSEEVSKAMETARRGGLTI